jgi:hypothetical protein
MELFLLGLLLGFIIGGVLMSNTYDSKVKKGLTPFIDDSGSTAWKKVKTVSTDEKMD